MGSIQDIDNSPFTDDFIRLATATMAEWHVPGVSMAILDGDQMCKKSFGIATMPSTPVQPETLFYVGSTTKAFTAAAIALIVDDNVKYPSVQWDTPVRQILGDVFQLEDEYASNRVTIEDLLSHRSGLARHDLSYGRNQQVTSLDVVKSVRHLPLTADLRSRFQYCNVMFVVAAHIIQEVTGQTLGGFLRERIWQPLGMHRTYMTLDDVPQSEHANLAEGYYYDGHEYKQVTWMPLHEIAGAGSMISNVIDYTKWMRALLRQTAPLTPAVCKAIWEPRSIVPPEGPYTGLRGYALGWHLDTYRGQRIIHHAGRTQAYGTELILLPDLDYSIVTFANTLETSNNAELTLVYRLIDEKLSTPKHSRFNWNDYGRNIINQREKDRETARSTFYPSAPSPPHALPAPLRSFVGRYHHSGYQDLNIYLDDTGTHLRADRDKTVWPQFLRFEHVTGVYFLAYITHIGQMAACFPSVCPVEFHMGHDGFPTGIGIRWEEEMKDKKIWLSRVIE